MPAVTPPPQSGPTDDDLNRAALERYNEPAQPSAFTELGDSGLIRFDGVISEEWFNKARGKNGILLTREMVDNHPVVGAMLFAIRMLMRGVNWSMEAASDDPQAIAASELAESCMSDMDQSWQDTLDQMLTFIEYGWSMSEVIYKVRQGPDETDDALRSKYTDKKVGIRKIALRSQDSLFKFEMNAAGDVVGMVQQPPQGGGMRYIPRNRLIHLRPTSYKNNPLGRSALRNAMVSYLYQKKMQDIEAIGIERDLAGYPVVMAPGRIMQKNASPEDKAMLANLRSVLKNIRRDSSEGVIMPSDTDKDGRQLYDLKLLSSGGNRQLQPDAVIQRYDQRIAMTVLADFVMIGNSGAGGGRGSYGMAEAKQSMFATAISAWLDAICEEINRQLIPQLMRLNNIPMQFCPSLTHSEVETPNLQQLGAYVTALSGAGVPLFPDENLEKMLRDAAGMPDPARDAATVQAGNAASNIRPVTVPEYNQKPQAKPTTGGAAPSGGGSAASGQQGNAMQ